MISQKPVALFLCCLFIAFFWIGCAQNTPEAIFNRGMRALEEKDLITASLNFDEFIQKFPEHERAVDAHWYLVNCYSATRDYVSARTVLEQIKEKFPDPLIKFNTEFAIAKTYFDEGYYDQAIVAFEEIGSSTTDPRIRIQSNRWTSASYSKLTQAATAINYLEKVLEIAANEISDLTESLDYRIQALANEADIYRASEQFDNVRNAFTRTLEMVKDVTGVQGIEQVKESAVVNWANSYVWAGDLITAATLYDQLHDNPYIREQTKPYLIQWKIQSLLQLAFSDESRDLTPEEIAGLVVEYSRLTDNYANTDPGITAHIEIARLVQDSTPEMMEAHLAQAVAAYRKMIEEPTSPDRPIIGMFSIAEAYIKTNKFDEAKQMIKQIKQTYSHIPQADQRADMLLNFIQQTERQNLEKAQAQSKDATE
jgi:tetratricopeptide (TPR) repeat protein